MRAARSAARFLWSQLTSMRTALVLLLMLALAAIPGSLVPQRSSAPLKVRDTMAAQPQLGKVYQALGLFDVYGSPWFAAIYLLLLISLVGCIVPRLRAWARTLRKPPPPTPRNLSRLPEHGEHPLADGADAATVLARAAEHLRGKRFRVRREDGAVAAERGYSREAGNIVFHLGLLAMLAGVAVSGLWGYRGTALVVERLGFSNSVTQYDELSAGARVDPRTLEPFTVHVDSFHVTFATGEVATGMPLDFYADTTVTDRRGTRTERLAVNHPLEIDGAQVHLLGHGYAADVTVTDGDGRVAYAGPVAFLPQDGNFSSAGVIKAPDARPQRLAFQGMFLPTATVDQLGPRSVFPDAYSPELFLNAWSGPPAKETGRPENVYQLDRTGLTQVTKADGSPLALRLKVGQSVQLPDGRGTLRFDGYRRWVKLQVSRTPGLGVTLGSLAVAVVGLCLSLFVRPRRLWAKVVTDADGRRVLQVAGLDRAEGRVGLDADVAALAAAALGAPTPGPATSHDPQDPQHHRPTEETA